MNRLSRLLLLLGICASLACGCSSKPDKPMPLTKENVASYMQKMAEIAKGTSPKKLAEAQGSPDKQKKMFYKSFIEPMESMGYSYDKTVGDLAARVLARNIPGTDTATTMMTSDLLAFAKNTREAAYQHGFISKETKELLDQVSLIFPR